MPTSRSLKEAMRSYGSPTGPAAPAGNVKRRVVSEGSDAARKAAIAADIAASRRPVKQAPKAPAPAKTNAFSAFRAADDLKKRKRQGEDY